MKKIKVILGPTAIGKTEISIEVAQKLGAEIVSCDSRQIYKYMDIGTNKPTKEQLEAVKHYMIDIIYPDEEYNAFMYAEEAGNILKNGKEKIVVGGSPLYMKALFEGFFRLPDDVKDKIKEIREELMKLPTKDLYEELKKVDFETAQKLHPNDKKRIVRALEIYRATGKRISELKKQKVKREFEPIYFGLIMDRRELYRRIEKRVDRMINQGLVEEVKNLLSRYPPNLNSLQTIGYKEIIEYLSGKMNLLDAVNLIKKNTKRYAKHQITFFKKFENVRWIDLSEVSYTEAVKKILEDG